MAKEITKLQQALLGISAAEFERLVLTLLEDLTDLRFYQASTGRQNGRDGATAHGDTAAIHVEIKRYGADTTLNKGELLGKLVESHQDCPDLDLWICVTTRDMPDQTVQALKKFGDQHGIVVEIIDWQPNDLPDLGVLCAAFPERTKGYNFTNDERQELQVLLNAPDFQEKLTKLRRRFSAHHIGWDSARRKMGEWLEGKLSSSRESFAHLGQKIILHGPDAAPYVERQAVNHSLEKWRTDWDTHLNPFALLGLEGMGKSWTAISWWRQVRAQDGFPLTLLFTRKHIPRWIGGS